jgi:hypothetical protein
MNAIEVGMEPEKYRARTSRKAGRDRQETPEPNDVVQVGAGSGQYTPRILECLNGLCFEITISDDLPIHVERD